MLSMVAVAVLTVVPSYAKAAVDDSINRGRYLVKVGGCNDCHTPEYAQSGGQTPEQNWLTGSPVGYKGPWGTSYPGNLRLTAANASPEQWLAVVRKPMLPPMPAPSVAAMSDADLLAIYDFLNALGQVGVAAPAPLPPGVEPQTPYYDFVPKNL